MEKNELSLAYSNRFEKKEWQNRDMMWKILCRDFFDKYIPMEDDVLDIAAGYCDFINNIGSKAKGNFKKGKRIAVDLNPDISMHAEQFVEVHNTYAQKLDFLEDECIDTVFMSNFLEHIKEKRDIIDIFKESRRVLRKDGKLMILQPNIRYVGGKYWDFFDHYTPLTEKSLEEALGIVGGFKIKKIIPRFLPYTTKCSIPQKKWMISLYCKIPLAWRIMGKQTFIIAVKE